MYSVCKQCLQEKATKYEKALGKINEAFGSIAEYRQEVSDLAPRHKTANDTVRSLVEDVEKQKQVYIQVTSLLPEHKSYMAGILITMET